MRKKEKKKDLWHAALRKPHDRYLLLLPPTISPTLLSPPSTFISTLDDAYPIVKKMARMGTTTMNPNTGDTSTETIIASSHPSNKPHNHHLTIRAACFLPAETICPCSRVREATP